MVSVTSEEVPEFTLGDRFRRARRWARIDSLDEMAERLTAAGYPIKRGAVSNWERDVNVTVDLRVVAAWSEVTGIPLRWFLEGLEGTLSVKRSDGDVRDSRCNAGGPVQAPEIRVA